jgi:hypothetical protein
VPYGLRRACASLRDVYVMAKKRREGIERDLGSRVLPSGLSRRGGGDGGDGGGYDEGQMSMLRHWVDELGESKVAIFLAIVVLLVNDHSQTRIVRFPWRLPPQYCRSRCDHGSSKMRSREGWRDFNRRCRRGMTTKATTN